jgi:hypothetical protein
MGKEICRSASQGSGSGSASRYIRKYLNGLPFWHSAAFAIIHWHLIQPSTTGQSLSLSTSGTCQVKLVPNKNSHLDLAACHTLGIMTTSPQQGAAKHNTSLTTIEGVEARMAIFKEQNTGCSSQCHHSGIFSCHHSGIFSMSYLQQRKDKLPAQKQDIR